MDTNKITYDGIEYTAEMRIRASDGTPRPPDRHNKKLSSWKDRNFTGTILTLEEPRDYGPHGGLTVKRDDVRDYPGMITFTFHHFFGGAIDFEPLEEAEAA